MTKIYAAKHEVEVSTNDGAHHYKKFIHGIKVDEKMYEIQEKVVGSMSCDTYYTHLHNIKWDNIPTLLTEYNPEFCRALKYDSVLCNDGGCDATMDVKFITINGEKQLLQRENGEPVPCNQSSSFAGDLTVLDYRNFCDNHYNGNIIPLRYFIDIPDVVA